jgi:hypothetical protein
LGFCIGILEIIAIVNQFYGKLLRLISDYHHIDEQGQGEASDFIAQLFFLSLMTEAHVAGIFLRKHF